MWNKEKITVVLPTKNNVGTVRYVIEDLYLTGYVDDMIVIDMHSNDNTINEVSYTKARLLSADSVKEAIALGIERARGELVLFMEPDGSYPAQEIIKLLAYAPEYDVVFASRTLDVGFKQEMKHFEFSRKMMDIGLRMSQKYGCPLITDIAANVFLIRRLHYLNKRFFLEYDDDFFFLEFIVRTVKNNSKFIQVPLEWRGEFGNRQQLNGFLSRLKYFKEVKRIIEDRQARAVIQEEKKEEEKKDKKKKEQPKREFRPEKPVFEAKQEQKKARKSRKPKKKSSSKTKDINKTKKVASSVIKKAKNTTNRFSPDEFS